MLHLINADGIHQNAQNFSAGLPITMKLCIMKYVTLVLFLLLTINLTSCGSSENTQRKTAETNEQEVNYTDFRDLADALRRMPGVQVSGAGNNVNIQIRGTSSFESETRPLYVIDGRIMGHSYTEVNRFLDMRDVSQIRVLTDSEAGAYGMRGANGVIEITLKR